MLSLGQNLASERKARGFSLREVEDAAGKIVSNAYLRQIENDRIKRPSPNIVQRLSELFRVSDEKLMDRAGPVAPSSSRANSRTLGHVATFVNQNLTKEEEAEPVQYSSFMRSRKRSEGRT